MQGFSGSYTRKILLESVDLLSSLWLWVVLGILISVVVKIYVSKKSLADFFSKREKISILLAALVGVLSPLGSYIIIPLAAALFAVGVSIPVLMALLTASPLINPSLFMLTAGAFGYEMAIVRTLSSFILGVVAGYTTLYLLRKGKIKTDNVLRNEAKDISGFQQGEEKQGFQLFTWELYKMSKYVSKFFFLAIILAAAVKILVSPNYIVRYMGGNLFLSVLFSTGAGVPFYVCGGAAIPVMQQLADLGMAKGSILAFFVSGPATKISNLVLMNAVFKKTIFVVYLLVGMLGAFVLGMLYNMI